MMSRLRAVTMAILLLAVLPAGAAAPVREPHVNVIGLIGDRAILRIDGEQVMLRRGESRNGVTLVGIEAGQAVLTIGARELRLGMGMDTGGIAKREGGSVEIGMNERGQFITMGMINGRMTEFLVDTGANVVSMTEEDAEQLGIDYRKDGRYSASATAGGLVSSWVVTLKSIQIGPIEVRNVVATVRLAPRHSPILLGMTFLSQVNLQQENNRLRLTSR